MTDAGAVAHDYRVRLLPRAAALEVELVLPAGAHRLDTPTWVPGAYAFLRYGRDVVDVRAEAATSGLALEVRRDGLAGWVLGPCDEPVRVRFRASLADPAWAELAGWANGELAVVHATRFLRAAALPGPVRVRWEAPAGFAVHHPGGAVREPDAPPASDAAPEGANVVTYRYPSFRVLLDTPVVFGAFVVRERTEGATTFHHVFLDRAVGMDTELDGFVDDVQKLARATAALFGGFPFDDYTFVWSFDPRAHWGLEHAHATLVGVGPLALVAPEPRFAALRVAVHELVHAWNVCRLVPRALARADLAHGSFPDELWIAEGFTRYYELVLTARAGLTTPERVLSNLVSYWRALSARPGYRRTSLVDSSHATFSNHHRFPNAANVAIDYYDGGMLAAFELDAHLRTRGDGDGASLDAAFRALWDAHGGAEHGYTQDDACRVFGGFGAEAEALARRVSETPGGLDTPGALRALGLEVTVADVRTVGLVLDGPRVVHVLEGGPAERAGLAVDDRLVLADGVAFDPIAFAWLVEHRADVDVVVGRGARQVEARLAPTLRPDVVRLALPEANADAVRARLVAWLGPAAARLPAGQALPLTFYDNFHGTERVT